MLLTEKQVMLVRRAGELLALGFLLFYLSGWITAVAGAEVYREIIGCSMITVALAVALATDFIQNQQQGSAHK